jgi:CHAD domain-containing protein
MAKAKQIRGIDCDATATEAIGLVLKTRMEELCALRERALDWSNPEGLHDMRVASRRLRSALRDFMPYAPKRRLATSLHRIKVVADALGEVRDQDVAIVALDNLAAKAPPEVSPGILSLANVRRTRRDEARAQLTPILDQELMAQLRANFLEALEEAPRNKQGKRSRHGAQAAPVLTYRDVARHTILERLKEFEKLSNSFYHPLKVKPLHRLRIAAKRLRYALELFEQCWGKQFGLFARQVASLQSELGNLHDCDVWIVDLGDELAKAAKQGPTASAGGDGVASLWLLTHFVKLRTKHFRKALLRRREWEGNDRAGQLSRSIQTGLLESPITTGEATIVSTNTVGLPSAGEL